MKPVNMEFLKGIKEQHKITNNLEELLGDIQLRGLNRAQVYQELSSGRGKGKSHCSSHVLGRNNHEGEVVSS